ncbi:MAG TPA: hypothetical protein VF297_08725 [Pyrinomonadaceae bacterium]
MRAELAEFVNRREPKDVRTALRLSEVLRDDLRVAAPDLILEALNNLANTTRANDLHPEIFPVLAQVLIREARASLRSKQLEGLRKRRAHLKTVEDNTDWENLLSSTRYKIEKQLFDILHPVGGAGRVVKAP